MLLNKVLIDTINFTVVVTSRIYWPRCWQESVTLRRLKKITKPFELKLQWNLLVPVVCEIGRLCLHCTVYECRLGYNLLQCEDFVESFFVELSVTVCLFTLPVNYTLFIFLVCSRVAFCQPSIKPRLIDWLNCSRWRRRQPEKLGCRRTVSRTV